MVTVSPTARPIAVDLIRTDERVQSRARLNEAVVKEYAELIENSDGWPFREPVHVFDDGNGFILADGYHRFFGTIKAGKLSVLAEVHRGTRFDALLFSLRSNHDHGLQRTNEDKRHAVTLALSEPELKAMSDRALAEICGVSHTFVAKIRGSQLATVASCDTPAKPAKPEVRTGRDGKQRRVQPSPTQPRISGGIKFDPAELEAANAADAASAWDEDETSEAAETSEPAPELKPAPPGKTLDPVGRPVPKKFVPLFEARKQFASLIKRIGDIKGEIANLADSDFGERIPFTSVKAELDNVRRQLRFAQYHTACPSCKAKGCPQCRNTGWLNEEGFNRLPSELKA